MAQEKRQKKKAFYGKTAKVGVLWGGFRRFSSEAIAIPTSMVLARLLTPEEFGIATVGRIFLLLAEHATQVGLPAAMIRIKVLRPEHMSTSLVFGLGTGVAAWVTLTGLAPTLGRAFDTPEVASILPVAALSFLIAPWSATARVPIVREFRFAHLTAAASIGVIAQSGTSVVLAWAGFGFWSLVYGHLIGGAAAATARLYFCGWKPHFRFSKGAFLDLWSYGVARQVKGLLRYLGASVDSLIVGRTLGMETLGLYDKAFVSLNKLAGRVSLGQGAGIVRIFAVIRDDLPRFQRAFRKVALARTIVAFPVFFGCVVVAPQLFYVLYGPQWVDAVPAFRVLCAFAFLSVMTRTASMANEAVGLMWWQVLFRAMYVALIFVGVVVGSRYGIVGVAWGVLGARLALAITVHTLLHHTTGFGWKALAAPLAPGLIHAAAIAALLVGVEVALLRLDPSVGPWTLLVSQAVVGAPAYLGLLLYSPFGDVRSVASEAVSDFFPKVARTLRLANTAT